MVNKLQLNLLLELAKHCSECAKKHFYSANSDEFLLKEDNSPLTKADLEVSKMAVDGLKKVFPNDTIISEETYTSKFKPLKKKFWLIDPIDGTKEFINGNINFTINFALIFLNKSIFGLIVQPCTDTVWYSFNNKSWKIKNSYNFLDSYQIKTSRYSPKNIKLIASKNHSDSELEHWINIIEPKSKINIGSSLKFCKIAEGKADIYPRNNPTMEWDTAAGHSILKCAGGNIYTKNGLELRYGKFNLKNFAFIAINEYNSFIPKTIFLGNDFFDLQLYNNKINKAVNSLKDSKLVCFPTETVYGLGAKGDNIKAINSVYKAKKRPKNNPLIAHVQNTKKAKDLVEFTDLANKLATEFWPGPLTIVLQIKKKQLSNILSQGKSTLGIRVPSHPVALDLIERLDVPILAPSANKSGGVSPTSAKHVLNDFKNLKNKSWEISEILDYGNCEIGIESTVIDCRGDLPIILREGYITSEIIEDKLKIKPINLQKNKELLSPGMLSKHYAPKTKVLINQKDYIKGSGLLAFGTVPKNFPKAINKFNLSPTENFLQAAELLYEGFRYLDSLNLKFIQVMPIKNVGLGAAINDRLTRASYNE